MAEIFCLGYILKLVLSITSIHVSVEESNTVEISASEMFISRLNVPFVSAVAENK